MTIRRSKPQQYPQIVSVFIFCAIKGCFLLDSCSLLTEEDLPVFVNFDAVGGTSAQSQLPAAGACNAWSVKSNGPSCSHPTSMLLVEMWLTEGNQSLQPGRTVGGVYLVMGQNPTPVTINVNGAPSFGPNASSLYMDSVAVKNALTLQRFLVPASVLNSDSSSNQTWYLSLTNTAVQPESLGYALRVTCMPAEQLPCPRPSPDQWQCSSPLPGNPGEGNGVCQDASQPGVKVCSCNDGFADVACSTSVDDLSTSYGQWIPVPVAGKSWKYFMVTVPPASGKGNARLLVELRKDPVSAAWYQPVLQLTNRSGASLKQTFFALPGVAAIAPRMYDFDDECTCEDPPCKPMSCYVPYQAEDLIYEIRNLQPGDPFSWWIGIYNNRPYNASGASTPPRLTLRARWMVGTTQQPASALCPLDCSGKGACINPPFFPPNAQQPLYSCDCKSGYGGPYCQGQLTNVRLSNNLGYAYDTDTLRPGQWAFYSVSLDGSNMNIIGTTMTLNYSAAATPGSSNLLMVLSPQFSNSLGQLYFVPSRSWVLNSSTVVLVDISTNPYAYLGVWRIGILNSDAQALVSSNFSLHLSIPTAAPAPPAGFGNFMNTLQLAIIGAVSGLVILLVSFVAIRTLLIRRQVAQMVSSNEQGQSAEAGPPLQRFAGVPSEITATFPVFKYDPVTYEMMRSKGMADEAQQVPAPAPKAPTPAALDTALDVKRKNKKGVSPDGVDVVVAQDDDGMDCEEDEYGVPQCSVCISHYETGEELRRLPCLHIFHQSCIDPWMLRHNTCPNCRTPLCPQQQGQPARPRRHRSGRTRSRPPAAEQATLETLVSSPAATTQGLPPAAEQAGLEMSISVPTAQLQAAGPTPAESATPVENGAIGAALGRAPSHRFNIAFPAPPRA